MRGTVSVSSEPRTQAERGVAPTRGSPRRPSTRSQQLRATPRRCTPGLATGSAAATTAAAPGRGSVRMPCRPSPSTHAIAGTCSSAGSGGIVASRDGGVTWTKTRGGAADDAREIVFDPLDPRRVYAVLMSYAPTTGGPGMVRSTDGGATWQRTASGFLPITIAVDHARPATVYAWGLTAGGAGASLAALTAARPGKPCSTCPAGGRSTSWSSTRPTRRRCTRSPSTGPTSAWRRRWTAARTGGASPPTAASSAPPRRRPASRPDPVRGDRTRRRAALDRRRDILEAVRQGPTGALRLGAHFRRDGDDALRGHERRRRCLDPRPLGRRTEPTRAMRIFKRGTFVLYRHKGGGVTGKARYTGSWRCG